MQRLQQQQRDLASVGKSKVASFGGAVVERLVNAIQQNLGRFHQPPIGPLGSVLALTDTR